MHLDDRLTIDTPEGVSIDLTLAGLGSRLGAALLDAMVLTVVIAAVVIVTGLAGATLSPDLGTFALGMGMLLVTAVLLGYFLVLETLNGGRTLGKAAFGIRVVTLDGSPLGFGEVAVRTLMRLVDFLPALYAAGVVAIVVTARNQRLGDVAAGTVVVRERSIRPPAAIAPGPPQEGWDVSGLGADDMSLVRRFLGRRAQLNPRKRAELAASIAGRLRPRVTGGEDRDDEAFLVQLVAEKEGRRQS